MISKVLIIKPEMERIKMNNLSPGSMHDTGCLGLVHWDDPEGWYGEGGHSSVLAWRIPGTGEPGGLPSMGSHRVRHD